MFNLRTIPLLLCAALLLFSSAAAECTVSEAAPLEAAAEISSYSRIIDVPGYGPMHYYAQNDPLWHEAVYEPFNTNGIRSFGSAGCGPAAAAIAVSKNLPIEALPALNDFARREGYGFPYCVCSVNGHQCFLDHELTVPQTPEEFAERLPTIFGSFAAGNNPRLKRYRSEERGTSNQLFSAIAEAYGLPYQRVRDRETALELLRSGWCAVTSVTEGLFTTTSHYLAVVHADEEWIYVFDPYMRSDYEALDPLHILEVVEPGLVRARLENYDALELSTFYMIGPPPSDAPADDETE